MAEFEYRFVTCGEHLYRFLRLWLADTMPRHELAEWLGRAGRAEEWMEYLTRLRLRPTSLATIDDDHSG